MTNAVGSSRKYGTSFKQRGRKESSLAAVFILPYAKCVAFCRRTSPFGRCPFVSSRAVDTSVLKCSSNLELGGACAKHLQPPPPMMISLRNVNVSMHLLHQPLLLALFSPTPKYLPQLAFSLPAHCIDSRPCAPTALIFSLSARIFCLSQCHPSLVTGKSVEIFAQ